MADVLATLEAMERDKGIDLSAKKQVVRDAQKCDCGEYVKKPNYLDLPAYDLIPDIDDDEISGLTPLEQDIFDDCVAFLMGDDESELDGIREKLSSTSPENREIIKSYIIAVLERHELRTGSDLSAKKQTMRVA